MSERKINLYNELKLKFPNHKLNDKFDLDSHQFNSHDMVEFAGVIGKQLLELAAKNAEVEEFYRGESYRIEDIFYDNDDSYIVANKQSILDTIKQVE